MHFELAYKWVFFLLPLPLLFYWLLPPLHKRRSALIAPFFDRAATLSQQKPRKSAWVTKRNFLAWTGLAACWICLLSAAAGPRYVGQPAKKIKTVRSFIIAADISFSMAQRDWVVDGRRL